MFYPQEVEKLLSTWNESPVISAALLPSKLPDSPAGDICPRCASRLGFQNLYMGGRGYVGYDVCTNPNCEYQRRAA